MLVIYYANCMVDYGNSWVVDKAQNNKPTLVSPVKHTLSIHGILQVHQDFHIAS
jgi:hypothetical protein